jgi:polysaccharide pyruvyl transferase WcaK-like protein
MPDLLNSKLLAALRRRRSVWRLMREWKDLSRVPAGTPDPSCVLVVPSDPSTLTGARGDEAMMSAALQRLASRMTIARVVVLTSTDGASAAARALGMQPLQVWRFDGPLSPMAQAVRAQAPAAAIVLGADIMDGYYSPGTTLRILALADLARRGGARVSITGFSFNETPSPELAPAFERVDPAVAFNLRDEISLARFRRFCRAAPVAVADVAFLLPPDTAAPALAPVSDWIAARRADGDRVVAINLHPMLVKNPTAAQLDAMVARVADAMRTTGATRRVAWLLLPHDFRGDIGDGTCLGPLAERLRAQAPDLRHLLVETAYSAAQLKAIAAMTDGVVTGRMHLAIAALGSGVPVGGFTYQDKFQGLLRHFDLPNDLLLSPAQLLEPGRVEQMLGGFVDALDTLRTRVELALPAVRALAERNVEPLYPPAVRDVR